MVRIVSWNVNSVNSRLPHLEKLIIEESPDVILLQELKCVDEKFPLLAIEHLGYNTAIFGQKAYNGVAILSKGPIEDVRKGLPQDDVGDARYIECVTTIGKQVMRVASVYVPNGQSVGSDKFAYKLRFFDWLMEHFKDSLKFNEKFVVGGDYNVAPDEIDVYDPKHLDGTVGFHIDERRKFKGCLGVGMYDSFRELNAGSQQFSWWDYRTNGWKFNRGMRIDQILVSPEALESATGAGVLDSFRGLEKASDHAPITLSLQI